MVYVVSARRTGCCRQRTGVQLVHLREEHPGRESHTHEVSEQMTDRDSSLVVKQVATENEIGQLLEQKIKVWYRQRGIL